MRLLVWVVLLAGFVPATGHSGEMSHHEAMILANAYGDTVWFFTDSILVAPSRTQDISFGARKRLAGATPPRIQDSVRVAQTVSEPGPMYFYIIAYASTTGMPLLVVTDTTAERPSATALVTRVADVGLNQCMARVFPDSARSPAVYEAGCFDAPTRWPCGWDIALEVRPLAPVRMTFLVVGRPAGGRGPRRNRDSSPVPIAPLRSLRPYDLSAEEVRATGRVVGDVIADFGRRVLVPLEVKGATVEMHADWPTGGHSEQTGSTDRWGPAWPKSFHR